MKRSLPESLRPVCDPHLPFREFLAIHLSRGLKDHDLETMRKRLKALKLKGPAWTTPPSDTDGDAMHAR